MSHPPRSHDTILQIARLRYEDRLTQRQIAARLSLSASTVSRALKQAEALGLVEIRVAPHALRLATLEAALAARFGLTEAIVVETRASLTDTRQVLGGAVARRLADLLGTEAVIGVSDGATTAAVASAAPPLHDRRIDVIPLIGGVGQPQEPTHPIEVGRTLAARLGGRSWLLPLPAVVDTVEAARSLLQASTFADVFDRMGNLTHAVVGIGAIAEDAAIVRHRVITMDDMADAAGRGAVGTICARFYDADGGPMDGPLDARTLAIRLLDLQRTPVRFAVAIGDDKLAAIRAALTGRIVNCLGTDRATAQRLLDGSAPGDARRA